MADYGLGSVVDHDLLTIDPPPRYLFMFAERETTPNGAPGDEDPIFGFRSATSISGTDAKFVAGILSGTLPTPEHNITVSELSAGIVGETDRITVKPGLIFNPQSVVGPVTNGSVYFDSRDGNLYLYSGGWKIVDTSTGGLTAHALSGSYHTGDLAYTQLDAIVDVAGTGGNALISRADHVHTDADGSSKITYANLNSIPSSFTPAAHVLATTGPHSSALPLTDLASYVAGNIIIGGAADWEALVAGTENYVLKMGAIYPAWGTVDYSELAGTQPAPVAHVLATTGPHSSALPLTDLDSYVRGSIVIGGGSDWESLAKGTVDQILISDGTDIAWQDAPVSGVTGSGTQYKLPVWDNVAGTTIGDSILFQDSGGTTLTTTGKIVIDKTDGSIGRVDYFVFDTHATYGTCAPAIAWYNANESETMCRLACEPGTGFDDPSFFIDMGDGAGAISNKLTLDKDGKLTIAGDIGSGGNITVSGTVDGVDVAGHVHTGADATSKITYANLDAIPSTFAPASHDFDVHTGDVKIIDIGSYAQGRLIFGSATDWSALSLGTETHVLKAGSIYPEWGTVDWSELTGTRPAVDITDLGSYVRGSIIIGGGSDWSALTKGTVNQILTSDGTDIYWSTPSGAGIGGSGTVGKIAKFVTDTMTIGNSLISESGSLVTIGGDAYISGGNVGIGITANSTYLIESPNADGIARIGRTHIGTSVDSDHAWLSHRDMAAASQFAVRQSAVGQTRINAASGQTLYLMTGGSTKAYCTATQFVSQVDHIIHEHLKFDYAIVDLTIDNDGTPKVAMNMSYNTTDYTSRCSSTSGISAHSIWYDILNGASSIDIKSNIVELDYNVLASELDGVMVKEFNRRDSLEKEIGFIAEDLPERIQMRNEEDKVMGFSTVGLISMLYAKIQSLGERIVALENA